MFADMMGAEHIHRKPAYEVISRLHLAHRKLFPRGPNRLLEKLVPWVLHITDSHRRWKQESRLKVLSAMPSSIHLASSMERVQHCTTRHWRNKGSSWSNKSGQRKVDLELTGNVITCAHVFPYYLRSSHVVPGGHAMCLETLTWNIAC